MRARPTGHAGWAFLARLAHPARLARPARSAVLLPGLILALLAILAPAAPASKGGPPSYPKIATYGSAFNRFTPGQWDTLSWFDLVVCRASPYRVAQIRERNPDQRLFFLTMPQNIVSWEEDQTWWYPDTSYSLHRLVQFYVEQNDWYLRDIWGQRISEWDGWAANWTPYCPEGNYGTSKGLTYAEWYASVAMPQIMGGSQKWEPWGWGSSAFDGVAWEVMADCPASGLPDPYMYADPDGDGVAEGIYSSCYDGGDEDPLSLLMHESNEDFYARLQQWVPADLILNKNRGGKHTHPSWAYELNGLKLEDWNPSRTRAVNSWWSWMYGRRHEDGEFIGDGYAFAEQSMYRTGIDELDGWDMTWIMVWTRGVEWEPARAERMRRWGMGTSMLGDGYFVFCVDQGTPDWFDIFDWDFGQALEDYQRELVGSDTLYVRRFEQGFVEVNPYYPQSLSGVPPEDARFAFWLDVDDLEVVGIAHDQVTLRWRVPQGEINGVDATEIRWAIWPITAENWELAQPAAAGLVSGTGGSQVECIVAGLEPETDYYFAAKNRIYGRWQPGVSNLAAATTAAAPPGSEPDETPPAAVLDLGSPDQGPGWIDLTWSAPGDDGDEGAAERYLLRYRLGAEIVDEGAWLAADSVAAGLPAPATAGTPQGVRLEGLQPGELYGIALRAIDEAGNLAGLSNPLLMLCPEPPDTLPPAPIHDLAVTATYSDGFDLAWTAPGDDAAEGTASGYRLAWLAGGPIDTETDWEQAAQESLATLAPAPAGTPQSYALRGLDPETLYGLALRAHDDVGALSPLALPALLAETLPAPDTLPPAAVSDLALVEAGTSWLELSWTAPGDDGAQGAADHFVLGWRAGSEALVGEDDWQAAVQVTEGLPDPPAAGTPIIWRLTGLAPETRLALAVRSYDDAGLASALSNALLAETLPPPDTLAPAAIADLAVDSVTPSSARLTWSCPGDDGMAGQAERFVLGWLEGAELVDEAAWAAADTLLDGLPRPLAAGEPVAFLFTGLTPERIYSFAVRADDDAGRRSPLGPPVTFATPAVPDTVAPGAVEDLQAQLRPAGTVRLVWTAAGNDGAAGLAPWLVVAIRPDAPVAAEADWAVAQRETLANEVSGGAQDSLDLIGLERDREWGFAVRYIDPARLAGPPSNAVLLAIPPPPDTISPDPVNDLLVLAAEPTQVTLQWSCPGDDGETGVAERFVLGWVAGAALANEGDWAAAQQIEAGLPRPGPPGSVVSYTLASLEPEQTYNVGVRTYDDAGLLSALGTPATVTLPAHPDTLPPERVTDLDVALRGEAALLLSWTAAGDDGRAGTAATLIVARRQDQMIETESDWQAARRDTCASATPGGAPDSLLLDDLARGAAWGFALRYRDEAGLVGPISNFATGFIPAEPVPADTTAPAAITDLRVIALGEGALTLAWSAGGDDGQAGEADHYRVGIISGARMTAADWTRADHHEWAHGGALGGSECVQQLTGLTAGESYGLALCAVDEAGNESLLSNPIWVPALTPRAELVPASIDDLELILTGTEWAEFAWSAPADPGGGEAVEAYRLGWAVESFTEAEWDQISQLALPDSPAAPGARERFRLESLEPVTTHWVALRSRNGLGRWSSLSACVAVTTHAWDAQPPPTPAAPTVTVDEEVTLYWLPVETPDLLGYNVYGRPASAGSGEQLNDDPLAETNWSFSCPGRGENFFVAVTALDASGNESLLSAETPLFSRELRLAGPFPHPIEGEARFTLTLPVAEGGAAHVSARIFSVAGYQIRRWIDETLPTGTELPLQWDTRDDRGALVGPGLYFLKLETPTESLMRKIYVRR